MTLRGPGGGDPGYDGNFSMNFEPSFGFELDCPTRISATTFKSRYNYSLTSHTPPLPFGVAHMTTVILRGRGEEVQDLTS